MRENAYLEFLRASPRPAETRAETQPREPRRPRDGKVFLERRTDSERRIRACKYTVDDFR